MIRRLPLYALAFALLVPVAQADDVQEVLRLDREIAVATWTGDADWFRENLTDDFVLVNPAGAVLGLQDVISDLATPHLEMEPYESSEVQIRLHGDTAVVTGRMLQRFTLGHTRYAHDLRYTDVYVKRKGRWLLAAGHTSTIR